MAMWLAHAAGGGAPPCRIFEQQRLYPAGQGSAFQLLARQKAADSSLFDVMQNGSRRSSRMGSPSNAFARFVLRSEAPGRLCWRHVAPPSWADSERTLEAGNDVLSDEVIQAGSKGFGRVQHRFLAGTRDDYEIAHIGCTDIGAQHCVQRLVRPGDRTQRGQLRIPDGSAVGVQGDYRENRHDESSARGVLTAAEPRRGRLPVA